jgi:hypothetical protein
MQITSALGFSLFIVFATSEKVFPVVITSSMIINLSNFCTASLSETSKAPSRFLDLAFLDNDDCFGVSIFFVSKNYKDRPKEIFIRSFK